MLTVRLLGSMSRGFAVTVPRVTQPGTDGAPLNDCNTTEGSGRGADLCPHVQLRHLIPLMDTFNHDNSAKSSVRFAGNGTSAGEFILTTHDD